MKNAWRQKNTRANRKGKEKSYSFVMSLDVHKQLKFLSRQHGASISETVEQLVKSGHDYRREVESELKQEKKRLKEEWEKKGTKRPKSFDSFNRKSRAEKSLREARIALADRKVQYEELALELCRCRVRLMDADLLDSATTIEIERRAEEEFHKMMAASEDFGAS